MSVNKSDLDEIIKRTLIDTANEMETRLNKSRQNIADLESKLAIALEALEFYSKQPDIMIPSNLKVITHEDGPIITTEGVAKLYCISIIANKALEKISGAHKKQTPCTHPKIMVAENNPTKGRCVACNLDIELKPGT